MAAIRYEMKSNLGAYEFFKFLEQIYQTRPNYVKSFGDMGGGASTKFQNDGIIFDISYESKTACTSVDASDKLGLLAYIKINFKDTTNIVIEVAEQKCSDALLEMILERLTPNGFKLESVKAP